MIYLSQFDPRARYLTGLAGIRKRRAGLGQIDIIPSPPPLNIPDIPPPNVPYPIASPTVVFAPAQGPPPPIAIPVIPRPPPPIPAIPPPNVPYPVASPTVVFAPAQGPPPPPDLVTAASVWNQQWIPGGVPKWALYVGVGLAFVFFFGGWKARPAYGRARAVSKRKTIAGLQEQIRELESGL